MREIAKKPAGVGIDLVEPDAGEAFLKALAAQYCGTGLVVTLEEGKKRRPKLTKRAVDALKPPKTDELTVFDSELPGFGIRVHSSGSRRFFIQYRSRKLHQADGRGRSRRYTIGPYGRWTPDAARKKAKQLLAAVERGEDPAEEKAKVRRAGTVAELAEQWLEDTKPHKRPGGWRESKRLIDRHVLPRLGTVRVGDVETSHVADLHKDLARTPYEANRVVSTVSALMRFAEAKNLRPKGTNPAIGVTRYREEKRQRYLKADELQKLGATLAEIEAEGEEMPAVLTAIRLLLFSGCRMSEVLKARWRDIDFDRATLYLGETKNGEPRTVTLNAPALAVLDAARQHREGEWVCPGGKAGHHLVDLEKPWQRIRERAGIPDVRLHDLRRTVGTLALNRGTDMKVVSTVLGHREQRTTELHYAFVSDTSLREAVEGVGAEIEAALKGRKPADVVPIGKK